MGNYCDAPIIADTATDKVIYESSYYYIGHFSRYIKPGAKRTGFSRFTDKLEVGSFKNPDGQMVVVALNRNNEDIKFTLRCEKGIADFTSLGHSIMTLLY